jgi:hypothetical protein
MVTCWPLLVISHLAEKWTVCVLGGEGGRAQKYRFHMFRSDRTDGQSQVTTVLSSTHYCSSFHDFSFSFAEISLGSGVFLSCMV